jgi:hydrogenase nickel incorporation protein HypA/HybF
MHELSIVESLLTVALEHAERAEAEKILKINLVVGDLSGVVRESVEFYFTFLSKDTIASQAVINFNRITTRLRCRKCGEMFTPDNHSYLCPACGDRQVDVIAGRELYIESLEVE